MSVGLPVFILAGASGDSHVHLLLACIAYAWSNNGLTAGTIAGHLAAGKLFRRQERGLELFLHHPGIVDRDVKGDVKGGHSFSRRDRDQVAYM